MAEMDVGRQCIREPMQGECSLVRHDPGQLVVFPSGEVDEPVDSTAQANGPPRVYVVRL
jgi:hypothetical protein